MRDAAGYRLRAPGSHDSRPPHGTGACTMETHPNPPAFQEKGKVTATLKPNTAESHVALYQQQQKRTLRYLSAPALKAIIDILLRNSYIQFQGALVQQKKGVPMGISPAVYFANFYLAAYEWHFLKQFHVPPLKDSPAAQSILKSFALTARYIDDLLSINNPHLQHLLFTDTQYHGIQGIYPRHHLNVTRQNIANSSQVPYLDMLICSFALSDGTCRIDTRLYDKRYQAAFSHIHIHRFIHRSSNVNESCKRNIFTAQFHRLAHAISNMQNFNTEVAHLIHTLMHRGFSRHFLTNTLHRQIARNPHLFQVQRHAGAHLARDIIVELEIIISNA